MLFETREEDRHHLGTILAGRGGHSWTQVKLDSFSPFFMIVIAATQQYLAETWLLATLDDLICCQTSMKLHFSGRNVSVSLVSPAHVNKSQQWLVEPLKEAWEIKYYSQADPAFRYVLHDGRTYHCGPSNIAEFLSDPAWERRF